MQKKIRVLLADDHVVVREGLKRLIEGQPDIGVVGEAVDGAQAIEQACGLKPDVVVMDVSMRPVGGAQATRAIKQQCPEVRVVALTVHEDKSYAHELLEAGASGYVLKRAAGEELIGAIRTVAGDRVFNDPRIAGSLLSAFRNGRNSTAYRSELSERETEVMRLLAQGFTNKEISAKLGVSVKTIETYKARSMEKLGLRSRVDIVRIGADRGWLGT